VETHIGGIVVDLHPTHLFGIAKHTVKAAYRDDIMGLAAGVAYHFLFSTVPLLIFFAALSAQVSHLIGTEDVLNRITNFLFDHLAYEQAVAIRDPIEQIINNQSNRLLSVSAILAIWGGKNGIVALMKALNKAYGVKEERSWPRRTATAIALTLALAIPILLISALILVRTWIERWIGNSLGTDSTWTTLWQLARWPLLALLLFFGLAMLYCFGPNINLPTWTVFPGAFFAVILWGLSTFALGFYFKYLAGYATAYGVLGALLAFVFWLYVISAIILVGGELNSSILEYLEQHRRAEKAPATTPLPGSRVSEELANRRF
jgi:membrane protein